MGKNNLLIDTQRRLAQIQKEYDELLYEKGDSITAQVYACFAIILCNKYHWNAEQVEQLFVKTQQLWVQSVENDTIENMIDKCENEVGIAIRSKKNDD